MLKNLSSKNVAWILDQIGITLKRRSKEDVFAGYYGGKNRVVIVPRNNKEYPTRCAEFYLEAGGHYKRNCRKHLEETLD